MAYTTINKSTDYFNTKLYTGNGSSGHAITGVGFQPDWVWIKNRTDVASHNLYDAVRGTSAGKLKSNTNGAQSYNAQDLSVFGTDGFTVGSNNEVNGNGDNMAAWCWKAGGSTSSNSDGDVTSTVSVNSTAGFSIVKWTNSGNAGWIGHGLGAVPQYILIKNMGSGSSITAWVNYHHKIDPTAPEDYTIYLNSTDARVDNPVFNDTAPTSTKFRFDSADTTDYIAYCFAEKTGYSKFGSYTGNANADGTFIYTGFKPAFVMVKKSAGTGYWVIQDNKRTSSSGTNPNDKWIYPNVSDAEFDASSYPMDLLSNGFKLRHTGNYQNSSTNYIYMAFGQSLVGTNNVPCTAR